MKKIVFIGGPTGSGKTDIAVKIAKEVDGELINADSRQIYKLLNIGTNKGEINELNGQKYIDGVPIHLIDIISPNERFSVFQFKEMAIKQIDKILNKERVPIIVGGTGLYIDSIIKDYQPSADNTEFNTSELEAKTTAELQDLLIKVNPSKYESLNSSDKNNKRRLIRSIIKKEAVLPLEDTKYEYIFLYPDYLWNLLDKRIADRVELMFKNGLVNEVKDVLKLFPKESIALQGTGYKEVLKYLEGEIDLQECINLVKISHRQYAKRQITWFEGIGRGYKLFKVKDTEEALRAVEDFYGFRTSNYSSSN